MNPDKHCNKYKKSLIRCRFDNLMKPKAKDTNTLGYTPTRCRVYRDLYKKCVSGKRVVHMGP